MKEKLNLETYTRNECENKNIGVGASIRMKRLGERIKMELVGLEGGKAQKNLEKNGRKGGGRNG